MVGCGVRRSWAWLLLLSSCGGKSADEPDHRDRAGTVLDDGGFVSTGWDPACEDEPVARPRWDAASCSIRRVKAVLESDLASFTELVVHEDMLFASEAQPVWDSPRSARVQRFSLDGELLGVIELDVEAGARMIADPDGFAVVDRDPSGDLRLRRFDVEGELLEQRRMSLFAPLEDLLEFRAVLARGELSVAYFTYEKPMTHNNIGFIHYARFDRGGERVFDVRLTDPVGSVLPDDVRLFCGGSAVTATRAQDARYDLYLTLIDDEGRIGAERLLDRAPQPGPAEIRVSALEVAGDGTLTATWIHSKDKEALSADGVAMASIGYGGELRWSKRLEPELLVDTLTDAYWTGSELQIGVDAWASASAWRISADGELLGAEELTSDRSKVFGFVATRSGYAALVRLHDPEIRHDTELLIATCEPAP